MLTNRKNLKFFPQVRSYSFLVIELYISKESPKYNLYVLSQKEEKCPISIGTYT